MPALHLTKRQRAQLHELVQASANAGDEEAKKLLVAFAPRTPRPVKVVASWLAGVKSRREAIRESRTDVRGQCVERCKGFCESCNAYIGASRLLLDHWLGGVGRRTAAESVETCWMICWRCNKDRTNNWPSAAHWNEVFQRHCKAHEYRFTPHIVHRFTTMRKRP